MDKLQNTKDAIVDTTARAANWTAANPGTAACIATGAVGVGLVAAPMATAGPLMGAAGYGPLGPVAGSMAAGAQAAAGNVVAGGLLATVQSAAMGGYGVAAVAGTVQSVGVGVIALSGFSIWNKTRSRQEETDPQPGRTRGPR